LEGKVKLHGRVDHASSLRFQAACDALLITSSKVVGGRDYSIAGKTFEYVAQVKPMLAFVCEGAQRDLLERTGLSIACPPDDPAAAADRIVDLLEGRCTLRPDKAFIHDLHIERITERFSQVVQRIAHP
ncbi:MAG: glycosyltransferase, partial [Flavobacteriales bacterium]|nr:glycosyltransferase [Flavobacteriales bacterium]